MKPISEQDINNCFNNLIYSDVQLTYERINISTNYSETQTDLNNAHELNRAIHNTIV